jgi:large subunit ribosomal protein L24
MKPDTERKKYYQEKLHKRKKRLHVHLSKELRSKLKNKKRSTLVRKGDTVKILRGPHVGKEAKVSKISTVKRKVYLEGVLARNAAAKEMPVPLEPSNLLLIALESTKERKEMFSVDVFKKPEKPKAKSVEKKEAKPAAKTEAKPAAKTESKPAAKTESKPEKTDVKEKPKVVPKPAEAPKPKEAPKR